MKTDRATVYPLSPQLDLIEFDRTADGAWLIRGRETVVKLSGKEWRTLRAVVTGGDNPAATTPTTKGTP